MTDAPDAATPAFGAADDPALTARERLLEALPSHVAFDGWSQAAIDAAAADAGVAPDLARLAFPRGGIDAALAFHRRGDRLMADAFAAEAHLGMGFTEKVTRCVRLRLEVVADHREAVRRGAALLALPIYAAEGARALWDTADAIWTAVGDASDDANWYTKRATLSGVYSATALYWLGDESPGYAATWDFLDRRIADVMRIEKTKADLRKNPFTRPLMSVGDRLAKAVKPPQSRRPAAPVAY
jgi:ubiquinone biosynthesis protein COQ9